MEESSRSGNDQEAVRPGGHSGQLDYWGRPVLQESEKKKTGLAIGIAAAAVLLLITIIVTCVLIARMIPGRSSPEAQAAQGIANLVEEIKACTDSFAGESGIGTLGGPGQSHAGISMSFTNPDPSADLGNFGIDVDAVIDSGNKKAQYDIDTGAYGFRVEVGRITAAGNTLYFRAPLLLGDGIYSLGLADLGKNFNGSAWSGLLDTKLPEDASYTLFELTDMFNGMRDAGFSALTEKYRRILEEAAEYSTITEKRDFEIGGKTVSCGGVQVSIAKDDCNKMLEALGQDMLAGGFCTRLLPDYLEGLSFLGALCGRQAGSVAEEAGRIMEGVMSLRLEQDYVVNLYLDAKGRIVNISTPADISAGGAGTDTGALAVDISFTGGERTLDEVAGGLYAVAGGQVIDIGLLRQAAAADERCTGDLTLSLRNDGSRDGIEFQCRSDWSRSDKTYGVWVSFRTGGTSFEFDAAGSFTDVIKGAGYTLELDKAALRADGADAVIMSGSLRNEVSEEEIDVPGNAADLLRMSQPDIERILYGALSFPGY